MDLKLRTYRFIAYSAVAFSCIAAVSLCFTLPLLYNYVQNTKIQVQKESMYCKVYTFTDILFS